jgi:hypothetical protein
MALGGPGNLLLLLWLAIATFNSTMALVAFPSFGGEMVRVQGRFKSSFAPMRTQVSKVACGVAMQNSRQDTPDIFEVLTQIGASLARPGAGAFVAGYRAELSQEYKNPTMDLPVREFSETLPSARPAKPLELYEYEACPFCRKVSAQHLVYIYIRTCIHTYIHT